MQSQLTIRLSDTLDKDVVKLAKRFHLKRSDIVRMALEKFIQDSAVQKTISPYDSVRHLIGSFSSGLPDLGSDHRRYLLSRFKKNA